jgi:hypothetical protein
MNAALDLLTTCRQSGITLLAEGDRLIYRGSEAAVTDDLLARLSATKPELLRLLTDSGPEHSHTFGRHDMDRILAGEPVRVWSGVLGCWLFWVRGEAERDQLIASGIAAGTIYTLGELRVVGGRGFEPEDIRRVHGIKREFDGTIEPPRPGA